VSDSSLKDRHVFFISWTRVDRLNYSGTDSGGSGKGVSRNDTGLLYCELREANWHKDSCSR
jgi:hypothetical protein